MLLITYWGGLFLGIVLLFIIRRTYLRGKESNNYRNASMSLALGGALFFGYMYSVALLESGPLGDINSVANGLLPGMISLVGIVAIIIGLLWRIVLSFKKS